jgi:threonine dehydrogenase-like Zn-dependent dehydrogenase
MAAKMAEPQGKTVAVWGAGAVGCMAAASAALLGATRVIVIDRLLERLRTVRWMCPDAETLNYEAVPSVPDALREMTGGRGPDACIDAVGMEARGGGVQYAYDRVKQFLRLETDRATALRQAIYACGKAGIVSVVGIYGMTDKFPMGIVTNKGLTMRSAQQHGQAYVPALLEAVQDGRLDPGHLLTHEMPLSDAVHGYEIFKSKAEGCIRAAFKP